MTVVLPGPLRVRLRRLRESGLRMLGLQSLQSEVERIATQIERLERLVIGMVEPRQRDAAAAEALGTPAVAVIIPTYNRPNVVGAAIGSVIGQSFKNWELAIIDDGSQDDTAQAISPFLKDPRIRYRRQENSGDAAARNAGIKLTTAPIIAYLDDDNLWYPDFLARAVDYLATHPEVDFVYGALVTALHLHRSRILWREFNRAQLEMRNYIDSSVIVHRRTLVETYGGWDPSASPFADWDLALRYSTRKPAVALDVLAACYRRMDEKRMLEVVDYRPAFEKIRARTARTSDSKTI